MDRILRIDGYLAMKAALILASLAVPVAAAGVSHAVVLAEKTSLLDYRYQWPAADAHMMRRHGLNGARADKQARGVGAPFFAHVAAKRWTVEGEAGPLLSLRGTWDSYTGGAHGMHGFEAILWNRGEGRDITVATMFVDGIQALTDITKAFCPALNAERARRRGGQAIAADGAWQNACPDLAGQVMLPARVERGRFTEICILLPPYEAGPYVEGSYEIAVPMTAGLVAQLKPGYRGVFAAR
jgi:hypothetical protein